MSTLQHISERAQGTRPGRLAVAMTAIVVALAIAAIVVAVASSGGVSKPDAGAPASAGYVEQPQNSTKYLATHRLPAPNPPVESPAQTEPKYLATHPSR